MLALFVSDAHKLLNSNQVKKKPQKWLLNRSINRGRVSKLPYFELQYCCL